MVASQRWGSVGFVVFVALMPVSPGLPWPRRDSARAARLAGTERAASGSRFLASETGRRMVKIAISAMTALIACATPAFAQQHWCWRFAGTGVSAAGTFVTENDADADGSYRITAITGRANAATITTLQPAGTSIPGNAGYPVDNLIRATAPHLTKHGFGFMAADGAYHNPFHAGRTLDYISRPPYADGKGAEPTIEFEATAAAGSHCATQ